MQNPHLLQRYNEDSPCGDASLESLSLRSEKLIFTSYILTSRFSLLNKIPLESINWRGKLHGEFTGVIGFAAPGAH